MPDAQPARHGPAVRCAVIDVHFGAGTLPALNEALIVEWDRLETLTLEVQGHLDLTKLRAVALQATAGLSRGVPQRLFPA